MSEDRFDQLLEEMRNETVPAADAEAAKERVRERLRNPVCAEFRSEFSGYLAGSLLESRRLLMEDHLTRCAACRRELATARGEQPGRVVELPVRNWAQGPLVRWGALAAAALAALYAGRDPLDRALAPSGPRATVESVTGGQLAGLDGKVRQAGSGLEEGDIVRTATGARAVLRLRDGSRLEMNERSELAVQGAWSGLRVKLERGDVIIEAAKQRRGHLQVFTRDATASVKGTVFAVSTGVAGSLVSVVEGAVQVEHSGTDKLVKPGEQSATSASYPAGGVRDAIAWSPSVDKYYALLAEVARLEPQVAAITLPTLRTDARLVDRLLPNTFAYGAIPNADGALERTIRLIEQRTRENAALREWWESHQELRQMLTHIQTISPMLGAEIAVQIVPAGDDATALLVAEVKAGREAAAKEAMDRMLAAQKLQGAYSIAGGLLLVSGDAASLAALQPKLGQGAQSAFAAELRTRYQRGAGWLWAVDAAQLFKLSAPHTSAQEQSMLDALGRSQLKHVLLEQRAAAGRDDNEAAVTFNGPRQGVASWLGTPGAFGSAEYISTESIAAVAASTRNPRQALEELLQTLSRVAPEAVESLRKAEAKLGINLVSDIAAALGTDFSLSMETIAVPLPGWVGALEVFSPAAIDTVAQRFVEAFNRELSATDAARKLVFAQETVSGRAWSSVSNPAVKQTIYWTADRGYLVVSADRALAVRAIATRAAGTPLVRSARFRERQPVTPTVHNSGFVWLNTRGALESLTVLNPDIKGSAFQSLLTSRDPVLIAVNGETERIAAFSRTRLSSLLIDLLIVSGADEPAAAPGVKSQPAEKKVIRKTLHAINSPAGD
ncbi:MAG: FecR domain-containing protein [Bryobacterales bacterium]|nr:FecR domain-containing protein [Bryobacterales bacterium]